MDEQIRRLIDVVHATICDNEEEFLRAEGMEVLTGTPAELAARMTSAGARWAKVVTAANIRAE